jgi:hypothetical protein
MLGYTSIFGHAIIDFGLFMPAKWFDEEYANLRKECLVPEELEFATKN